MGALLIASPWIFGFSNNSSATYVPVALGLGTLIYSLLTDYEPGLVKVIPFKVHLVLDVLSGMLLAASPWIFGFASQVSMPHVVLGLLEVIASVTTQNQNMAHRFRHA